LPQPASAPSNKSAPATPSSAATSDPNAAARPDYEVGGRLGTREGWEEFLRRHPNGFYADLARAQLIKLTGPAERTTEKNEEFDSGLRDQAGRQQSEKERSKAPPTAPAQAGLAPAPPNADSMTDERRDYALAERVGTLEGWDWYLRRYSQSSYA